MAAKESRDVDGRLLVLVVERDPHIRDLEAHFLYVVRHLVGAHQGRVTVASSSTAGTSFTVSLPRRSPPGATMCA